MNPPSITRRARFAVPAPVASAAPSILSGPLYRRARFALPALALLAGVAILTTAPSALRAANAADPVLAGATDLGVKTTANYTTVPTTTSDVEFLATTTYTSPLGLSAALSIGTLDDFNTSAIAINGTGLLTLNTAANSVAPNAADLLYVATGGNLSIQTTGGITFAAAGNVDDAGTLSLGTSPVTITAGTTLSFLGAGATTLGGNIAATSGAVAINDAGGSVTFSGTNAYTGGTTIYNGGLLSADTASSLGNGGAIAINSGGVLRTLATGGVNLGGGAVSLNNGTIQVGNASVALASASLPGVLTFTGATTINLQDNGTSTAALTLNGAGTGLVRNSNNAATLILNGATALNGTTDTLTVTNYSTTGTNATFAGIVTNGILPSYEVGTQAGSTNADFLTVASGTNIAGSPIKVYSGYTVKAAAAAQTFSGTVVYELGTGASTITGQQTAYGIKFDSGATLALGTQTFSIGGGSSNLGGIIFNGTGDSITGGILQGSGSNGEVDIYTASSATISSNLTTQSGGGAFTFFGPGTLTLSGTSLTSTNGGGVLAFNGNVNDNLTTGFVTSTGAPFILNNGTLTLNSTHNNNLNGANGVTLTVNSLGTLDLAGSSQTIYRLAGGSGATALGGTITSGSAGAVLTLNNQNNGNNDTFYGNITSANLALTKLGNNTETLSGLENYKGATTVNGGGLTFAPVVAGVNDSLGALSFAQGAGTVQSTYQGTGTTTLTFSNLAARAPGASGNFTTSGGTNGTTNSIVLTNFNGAAPVAKTLLDPGYFFGGNAYATVDAGGFLRAYATTDTNAVTATGTNTIVSNAASNVFLTGGVSGQTSANVNTLNLGATQSLTLNTGATFGTNGIIGSGLGGVNGGSLTTTTSGGELVVRWSGGNQVQITSPIVDNGTSSFTDAGGSVYLNSSNNTYKGVTTVDGGTLYFGGDTTGNSTATGGLGTSSGVVLNSAGNLSFYLSTPYSFTNPITTGTLESGSTINQAGTGTLTLGSVTNTGNTSALSVTRSATGKVGGVTTPTGALTLGTLNGNINVTDNSTVGATAPTTITQTGTGLTINNLTPNASGAVITLNGAGNTTVATIGGPSGSTFNFNGTGTTTYNGTFGTTGQIVNLNSGTVNLFGAGAYSASLRFNGATVNTTATSQNFYQLTSLTTTAGTFNDLSGYGLRMGSTFGSNSGSGIAFTGTQTGGSIIITGNSSQNSFELGSSTNAVNATYALSGGTLTTPLVDIGAGTGGTGTTSFTLSGTGKLLSSIAVQGLQGSGAIQNFVFNGGTLAAFAVNFTNLTTSGATTATPSTFTNAGGNLAPGDVGTTGLTTITGNYSVTSANAAYSVDLGTTAAATAFQNGTTGYDQTNVSLTAALGGKLNVGLVGGFLTTAPTAATNFTILQSGTGTKSVGSLSGTFTNTEVGKTLPVVALNGTGATGLNSFSVTYNAGTATANGSVVLGNYSATNTYTGATGSTWDAAAAANWSVFDPGSTSAPATVASGAVAQFADNAGTGAGANAVTLNSTRNIQGISFSSGTAGHNYTINNGGAGAIILDNTANATVATINDTSAAGNANTISVPITLNSPLAVAVTNAANTLTVNGGISGAQMLTKNGAGTLVLGGTNTYTGSTNVSTGAMLVNGTVGSSATPAGLLTVNSTATLGGSGMLTVSSAIVNAGGTLAPGAAIGATTGALTLNTMTGLTINGGLNIGVNSGGVGTFLATNNLLTLGSGATLNITGTLDGVSNYDIANYGTLAGTFAGYTAPAGYTLNYAGTSFGPADIELDVTAVPEPSTWVGMVLLLLGVFGLKLRRKVRVG